MTGSDRALQLAQGGESFNNFLAEAATRSARERRPVDIAEIEP
ncbi:hypothetical protein [Candidatus Poriferisodalis sp.]